VSAPAPAAPVVPEPATPEAPAAREISLGRAESRNRADT
jgi:hypothetical protein